MSLTSSLDVGESTFDETIGRLDVLLQDKLLQISELSECFQSGDGAKRPHSKTPQTLLHEESFRQANDGGDVSDDDSFEDLRV